MSSEFIYFLDFAPSSDTDHRQIAYSLSSTIYHFQATARLISDPGGVLGVVARCGYVVVVPPVPVRGVAGAGAWSCRAAPKAAKTGVNWQEYF